MIRLLRDVETLEPPEILAVTGPLRLRRAWPRGGDRMLLEYVAADGEIVPGQLVLASDGRPDESVARRLVTATRRRARSGNDVCSIRPGIVLQARGADRRLRGLPALLQHTGASLVSHRPERRAVVRLARTNVTYAKLVRPGRTGAVVSAARAVREAPGLRVARLVRVHEDAGQVEWERLPGRSLHDVVAGGPTSEPSAAVAAVRAAGRALRALHDTVDRGPLDDHLPRNEVAVLERWIAAVASHDVRLAEHMLGGLRDVRRGFGDTSGPTVALHRDFHDKQVVVTPGGTAGVLDVDTLARGEAALDVANLLVHLELRAIQGRLPPARLDVLGTGLLDGYGPGPEVTDRLAAYADATRLRLACVYAFRPGSARVVPAFLDRLPSTPGSAP